MKEWNEETHATSGKHIHIIKGKKDIQTSKI